MDLDVKIPSKKIMETLRHQIAELESLEATGVATSDTCEMLVDLHNLLDKFDAMLLERCPRDDTVSGSLGRSCSIKPLSRSREDVNTVTHVLGIRTFGTQLLCEQVIGRALRRMSYEKNEEGLFNVEYADVFGIPFDFTAKPVIAPSQPPRGTVQIKAIHPERDALEIRFPRVECYRVVTVPNLH